MAKCLINFLCILFLASSLSFAKEAITDATLAKEYGRDLTNAPFFLKFSYYKEFNKDWNKTDYLERKAFLLDYEINLAKEQKKEKEDAKAAAILEKQRLLDERIALRQQKEKLKAEKDKEKALELADKERQKEFDESVKEQKKELQEMMRRVSGQGSAPMPSQGTDQGSTY